MRRKMRMSRKISMRRRKRRRRPEREEEENEEGEEDSPHKHVLPYCISRVVVPQE